jgi:hypothetical protein
VISTKTHGIIDYVVAALLIAAPFILGVADGGAPQWVPMLLGVSIIVYSLLTRYELSIGKLIPMPIHLGFDAFGGILLIGSPWAFEFAEVGSWPYVVAGVAEIGVVAMSQRHSPVIEAA